MDKGGEMSKRRYIVYFDQVNADTIEVEAGNEETAVKKATKIWLEEVKNGDYCSEVVKMEREEK